MKKRWRDESLRLRNWDYGGNGSYFITLNTKDRRRYFGQISDQKMILSEIGNLALNFWKEIPGHFPFVELGEFVIMPDHIHGVLFIDKKKSDQPNLLPSDRMPKLGHPSSGGQIGRQKEGMEVGHPWSYSKSIQKDLHHPFPQNRPGISMAG
jgi:REP element-mobilizing transposase RayT